MEQGRKLIIGIGLIVFVVIGWITWITFRTPSSIQMNESIVTPDEMTTLRHDLHDFIAERMKKEKPGSELISLELSSPMKDGEKVKIPYILTFKEAKEGTTATVQAVAFLDHEGAKYKVVKVVPSKETITYDETDSVIKLGDEKK